MDEIYATNRRIRFLLISVAVLTMLGLAVLSYAGARLISEDNVADKVLGYAADVQGRTDATAEQFQAGIDKLKKSQTKDPCSESQLTIMRDVDFSSSYLQAIGFVSDNRFVCSSLGRYTNLSIGKVEFVSSLGVAIRAHVTFPFSRDKKYAVIESEGYAAVINKDLPIDTTTGEKDVSLATFSLENYQLLSSRGYINPKWLSTAARRQKSTFIDGGYVIAVVRSGKFRTGSVAVLPETYVTKQIGRQLIAVAPIALISGAVLAFLASYLARSQVTFASLLNSALRRREFFVLYQPSNRFDDGKMHRRRSSFALEAAIWRNDRSRYLYSGGGERWLDGANHKACDRDCWEGSGSSLPR